MLKFLLPASLLSAAHAAGIDTHAWSASGDVVFGTPLVVDDPIGTGKDAVIIKHDVTGVSGLYAGLWAGTLTSHTEQAVGGPVTKVACATSPCTLPLYMNGDKFTPVPAGTSYAIYVVDGDNLNYGTATYADNVQLDILPYIYAWGSTKQHATASPTVERGDDILIYWNGYAVGDVIEYKKQSIVTAVNGCPVDYHIISPAEAALGSGVITLKTKESSGGGVGPNMVTFPNVGAQMITAYAAARTTFDFTGTPCTHTFSSGSYYSGQRQVTIADTDTIGLSAGQSATPEAGSTISLTYSFGSPLPAGTYVGLHRTDASAQTYRPTSHTADPDGVAGFPLSVAFLPTGATAGVAYLDIPLTTFPTTYAVYVFNANDAGPVFTPLADTSYSIVSKAGYQDAGVTRLRDTDVTIKAAPTGQPSGQPSDQPSGQPSGVPTGPTGQPTGIPTSSPSFVEEPWGEYVWTEKRHRKAGMCENQCSGHGTCEVNGNCKCFKGLDGEAEWTGPDCSLRTCPFDFAWVGLSINSNNLHPWAECSNKGICDTSTGECNCFTGYEGAACQRTVCPDNCNDQGTCWPEKHLATKAGRTYDVPWDAMKHVGCLCDAGYRGPACDQQECPSGADPLSGYGNEAGRDCSGRGICDYSNGICACFTGFFGTRCQHQTTVM